MVVSQTAVRDTGRPPCTNLTPYSYMRGSVGVDILFSLATRGTYMESHFKNLKIDTRQGDEAAASEVSSEAKDMTAPVPEVVSQPPPSAGPTVPLRADGPTVMEQVGSGSTEGPQNKKRKNLTGSAKKRLRKQRLEAGNNDPTSSKVVETGSKRKNDQKDSPPADKSDHKRPKSVHHETRKDGGGAGLTLAQKTNPLTMVVSDVGYPEEVLSEEQFWLFRKALTPLVRNEPADRLPRFEASFFRGGVFIFVASNPEAKAWLTKTVAELRPWEGARLKVSGVEVLQRMLKATVRIPGELEDVQVVFKTLEAYNPSLKTSTWRHVNIDGPQAAGMAERNFLLVIQVPESQARALAALNFRPFYDFGRVTFRVASLGQDGSEGKGASEQQP